MKTLWRQFKAWWFVWTGNPWVYRVYYPDGQYTYLLAKQEAKSLAAVFGGKVVIDWKYVNRIMYGS